MENLGCCSVFKKLIRLHQQAIAGLKEIQTFTKMVAVVIKKETYVPWEKNYEKCRWNINVQRLALTTKVCIVKDIALPVIICDYES